MASRTRKPGRTRAQALASASERYVLRLYVTGATARSLRAIASVRAICEQYLKDRYQLEVVDIYQHPDLLSQDQIVAVPTLVKQLPVPSRLLVGDFSRRDQLLHGLGLGQASHPA
jgi:circadian clock protein KaiB